MHLGFFDFIHMGIGKSIGEAGGSNSYLPITKISRPCFNPFDDSLQDWYESIQSESRKLAIVLSNGTQSSIDTYTYAIREIVRNVFEHSGAIECYVCGQRWFGGKVEIAIIDEGAGILSTLKESYDIHSDDEALDLAVMPGTSRINAKPEGQNVFKNSGYGLHVLSEIGTNHGWFALGSGEYRMISHSSNRYIEEFRFPGTFIGIQIFKPIENFEQKIKNIITTAEKYSRNPERPRRASSISKIIDL